MLCPNCNTTTNDADAFCPNCGAPLAGASPSHIGQPHGQVSRVPPSYAGPVIDGSSYNAPQYKVQFACSIIALVTTCAGLAPISIIIAAIAIAKTLRYRKQGVYDSLQTPTIVISVISIVASVVFIAFVAWLFGSALLSTRGG